MWQHRRTQWRGSALWTSARSVANRVDRDWNSQTACGAHSTPIPGHAELRSCDLVIISQLRVVRFLLTRDVLHRIGRAADLWCTNCCEPEPDSKRHLLTECPSYCTTRTSLWKGPFPTMDTGHWTVTSVLGSDADLVVEYLWRVGRADSPVDAVTTGPPA